MSMPHEPDQKSLRQHEPKSRDLQQHSPSPRVFEPPDPLGRLLAIFFVLLLAGFVFYIVDQITTQQTGKPLIDWIDRDGDE